MITTTAKTKPVAISTIDPSFAITPNEATAEVKRRRIGLRIVRGVCAAVCLTPSGYEAAIAETAHAAVEQLLRKIGGGK